MHLDDYDSVIDVCIQGGPKKLHTAFFAITLPTRNHFS